MCQDGSQNQPYAWDWNLPSTKRPLEGVCADEDSPAKRACTPSEAEHPVVFGAEQSASVLPPSSNPNNLIIPQPASFEDGINAIQDQSSLLSLSQDYQYHSSWGTCHQQQWFQSNDAIPNDSNDRTFGQINHPPCSNDTWGLSSSQETIPVQYQPAVDCDEVKQADSVKTIQQNAFSKWEAPSFIKFSTLPINSAQDIHVSAVNSPSPTPESIAEVKTVESTLDNVSYDICLGLILLEDIQLRPNLLKPKEEKDVVLQVRRDNVILEDLESKAYCGLVGHKTAGVIMALLAGHKATLSASIKSNDKLEILVYSLRRDGDEIGDFLSDHDWFLQQPEAYDPSTAYRNPQWLCRPGTEFETSWQRNEMKATLPTGLGAAEKKKVAELLDSAVGPAVFKRAQVSDMLVTELKEYQIQGLSMMVEKETGALTGTEFPSLWVEASDSNSSTPRYYNTVIKKKVARPPKISRGGLLADEMGLGKTLTALALISGSLHPSSLGEPAVTYPTLIVSPLSTLTNWECQIETHFKPGSISFAVYHGSGRHQLAASLQNYNIILTTYDILRAECSKSPQGYYKTATQTGILHSIDWHRVILDEAHVIRNRSSKLFRAVQTLNARHRWCLTGTPINNSIEDLGSLVEFLRVHPFDNPAVFKNTFMNSSRAGSCWERLRTLVQCITLRRTKASVGGDLDIPPRHEVIQSVYLDEGERHIYDLIKRHFTIAVDAGESSMSTFSLILRLRQACNHGRDLLHETLQKWLDKASMFSSLPPLELRTCEVCDTMLDGADLSCEALECLHQVCRACLQRGGTTREKAKPICPLCNSFPFEVDEMSRTTTASPMGNGPALYRPSSKVKALLQNLKDFGSSQPSTEPPAKSVVFSTWTSMLDLIGRALSINGFNFQRLDGTKSLSQRRQALAVFRKDPSCTVLLASIGCAGVGIDLTAASRVHIVEPGWNPMLERQALDRVHRLGQTKEVISFRYVVAGTDSVEEYIRRVQERKIEAITASLESSAVVRSTTLPNVLEGFRESLKAGAIS